MRPKSDDDKRLGYEIEKLRDTYGTLNQSEKNTVIEWLESDGTDGTVNSAIESIEESLDGYHKINWGVVEGAVEGNPKARTTLLVGLARHWAWTGEDLMRFSTSETQPYRAICELARALIEAEGSPSSDPEYRPNKDLMFATPHAKGLCAPIHNLFVICSWALAKPFR